MKIVIMGTGGLGGYYGALLARSGHEVHFVARGHHLQAICEKGLQVRSVHGGFLVRPARATDNPAGVGEADLVLFTTKAYQTEEAVELVKPVLGPETVIVPLQNGVDAADRIGSLLGMERLLGGMTWISAAVEAPGVIGQYSSFRRIVIGELDGRSTRRIERVRDVLAGTGVNVEVSRNISEVLWTKFAFISSVSAMGCLTRVSLRDYRTIEESYEVLKEVIGEIVAVAKAKGVGVGLAPDILQNTLATIGASDGKIKPSMQRDAEAGRVSELESMIGIVVRLGREMGVPTPVMRFAYAVLKPGQLLAGKR
ncbi:MAG TPA: 2-dehydropantoate 2-reductase [Thermodesulfobacteriota bacterium]|nr:2-dehydropantoate 2-reductase [Thermodesulfobacteriota bacterium]